jgi:hypothetical protein
VAYWGVNQRRSYAAERRAGILWAPTAMADGGTRSYWTAMTDLVAGDLVFHFAEQRIRAVSRVRAPRGVPKVACHAAYSYSWISPPRRSRRRNPPRIGPPLGAQGTDGTGAI